MDQNRQITLSERNGIATPYSVNSEHIFCAINKYKPKKKHSSSLVDREMQIYELKKTKLSKRKDLKYMQEDKAYNKSITKRIDRGMQQHNILKGLFK